MEDWRLTLQKVELYRTLADYYRYSNPEMHMYYFKKYVQMTQKLNEYVRAFGDPFEQQQSMPAAVQPNSGKNNAYPMPGALGPYSYVHPYAGPVPPFSHQGNMETGRLRMMHGASNALKLDIYVNQKKLAKQLTFKQVTDYVPLSPGQYHIKAYAADDRKSPILESRAFIQPGNTYTVAAAGSAEKLEFVPFLDEPFVPPKMTKLRFVHLGFSVPAVDFALKEANVVFPGVVYRKSSPYVPLKPGSYDFEIRLAGSREVLLQLPNLSLEADRVYSIAAVPSNSRKTALDVVLLPS